MQIITLNKYSVVVHTIKTGRTIVVLFFMHFLVLSANAQTLPLDSVLARIERNNPALLSFKNKINASEELANGAKALPAPKAGVMLDNNPYTLDYPKMIDLSISQAFPNRKELNAKEDYLKSLSDIELKSGEQIKNQFFTQAKMAYFELYITERKIEVIKNNIQLMKDMIEIATKNMESGMGDLGSIFKIKARLADEDNRQVQETSTESSLRAKLNYLMAIDLKQMFATDTSNLLKDYRNKVLLISKETLEQNRSDIQKMNSEINTMKLSQTMMSGMSKPMFEVGAKHYMNIGHPDMFAVEAMMTIPIAPWSSKGYKSSVKSMNFSIAAMEQEKQGMLNEAYNKANTYIIKLNSGYAAISNYKGKIIPAYKKSFDAYLISYSQNTADLMKVVLAWDDLQTAQMAYYDQLEQLLKAQAEYEGEMQIR